MAKVIIVIKVNAKQFSKLIDLGNRVYSSLISNPSFVPDPALTVLQSNITDCINALALVGPKGNRGSHADYLDLVVKAKTLLNTLRATAGSCMSQAIVVTNNDQVALAALLGTTGYALAEAKSPVAPLQEVQNLRNIKDKALDANAWRARFKRPVNTKRPADVKAYQVFRNTVPVFSTATLITTVTATTFIDRNETSQPVQYFYFVRGVNGAGPGSVSSPLAVQLGV